MKAKRVSGAVLAEKLGYKNPSGVTNRLGGQSMSVETLVSYIHFYNHERIQTKTGVAPLMLRLSA